MGVEINFSDRFLFLGSFSSIVFVFISSSFPLTNKVSYFIFACWFSNLFSSLAEIIIFFLLLQVLVSLPRVVVSYLLACFY